MATKKSAVEEAVEAVEGTATATEEVKETEAKAEKTFTIEALSKHCRKLFGVPSVVFAGATAELDTTKKYAVSEVKSTIENWCKKEVK